MQIIDPHLHLFNLAHGQYDWLRAENPPAWPDKSKICRDFNEIDLDLGPGLELAGYVHLEAGFDNQASWREIDWIERQAELPLRTVGHLDLRLHPQAFAEGLNQLKQRQSVVGVRHIFDEAVNELAKHPNTIENLRLLAAENLHFELQFSTQNRADCEIVDDLVTNIPELNFILNHAGFCSTNPTDAGCKASITGLKKLAQLANLRVKSSGFEMCNRKFKPAEAARLTGVLCELFGDNRVMLASNFPLITLSMSYGDYWAQMIEALQSENLPVERLIYQNAKRIYRFD